MEPESAPQPVVVKPGHLLLAFVDGPDDEHLTCITVFDWDRSFPLPDRGDPRFPAWLKKLGLKRPYKAMVDISERPDIGPGEPFPFVARAEPEV